ncbi:MAG: selenium metabolism-associated LysR family transcriptional regulator [Candidatus Helarchaeota archaeon]
MKIAYLENFITICQQGSFSSAAKILKRSQGAISQQVALLEKEFGDIRLFKRTLKGVELTREGEILLKTSKKILDELEIARKEIDEIRKTIHGTLKISASTIPGEHVLPRLLIQFKKENPTANFEIINSDSYNSIMNLINDKVDLASTGSKFESNVNTEQLVFLEIAKEELVVIVPPNHELAKKGVVSLNELVKFPYISREETSGTRREMEKLFKRELLDPNQLDIYLELASTESIITAVSEGNGWSIVSSIAAKKAEKSGIIQILRLNTRKTLERKFYLIRKKGKVHSTFLNRFWEFIQKSI